MASSVGMSVAGIERITRRQMGRLDAQLTLDRASTGTVPPSTVHRYKCDTCPTIILHLKGRRGRRPLQCPACTLERSRAKARATMARIRARPRDASSATAPVTPAPNRLESVMARRLGPQDVGTLTPSPTPRTSADVVGYLSRPGVASIAFPLSHRIHVGEKAYVADTLRDALELAIAGEGWNVPAGPILNNPEPQGGQSWRG